jgi:hypothetical protein
MASDATETQSRYLCRHAQSAGLMILRASSAKMMTQRRPAYGCPTNDRGNAHSGCLSRLLPQQSWVAGNRLQGAPFSTSCFGTKRKRDIVCGIDYSFLQKIVAARAIVVAKEIYETIAVLAKPEQGRGRGAVHQRQVKISYRAPYEMHVRRKTIACLPHHAATFDHAWKGLRTGGESIGARTGRSN